MRQELLTWSDVDKLIDALLPQFTGVFEAILMITRGGIVPGGLISEALDVKVVLTAAVDFPVDIAQVKLMAWPDFLQFPDQAPGRGAEPVGFGLRQRAMQGCAERREKSSDQ